MKEEHILFHANLPVASLCFEKGIISSVNEVYSYEHLPSRNKDFCWGLKDWWVHRVACETQENCVSALRNLALSVSDSYWIKPISSEYQWRDINLFKTGISIFNPDFSTAGRCNKHWIYEKNKFKLIKQYYDIERCCNEVFATYFHKEQSLFPCLEYEIIDSDSVICDCFTSADVESITVWDAVKQHSENFRSDIICACIDMGLDGDYVKLFLNYIVQADFILGNKSRHPRNISVLRNPNTLKAISMAPIYDNGSIFSFNKKKYIYCDNEYLLSLTGSKPVLQDSKFPKDDKVKEIFSLNPTRLNTIVAMYNANISNFKDYYGL